MLCSKLQVPLPKKGIIIRKTSKHQYVFKVLKTYRDQNGHPTNTRTAIGKLDPQTNMLIPNNNYWKHYQQTTTTTTQNTTYNSIHSIGATYLIEQTLKKLQITNILTNTFGQQKTQNILTAVKYIATQGNIFDHIQNWCETHNLHHQPYLTSPAASQLFNTITLQDRLNFFKNWIALQHENEYYAYDVTSFSTYSTGITEAEWGYNRDKEKLPQINIGCYLGQKSGLPAFYVTYPGSIVDKSHLPYMMAYNETLNISKACFVMDRGFCTEANIKFMHESNLSYVLGVEMGHRVFFDAVEQVREGIVSMRYRVEENVYGRCVSSCFYGVEAFLYVFYDSDLAVRKRGELYRRVEVDEERLCQLEQLTRREAKRYRRFFKIDLVGDGSFRFERDYDRIDRLARDCGFFCLFTDVGGFGCGEVLGVYRRRDVLEKGFDDLKNFLDMRRLRVHSSGVLDGKLFVAFVALIVVSEISNCLEGFMRDKGLSKVGVFCELEKVRVVVLSDGVCLMNPLSKLQRSIFEACGLTEEDLKKYVETC